MSAGIQLRATRLLADVTALRDEVRAARGEAAGERKRKLRRGAAALDDACLALSDAVADLPS